MISKKITSLLNNQIKLESTASMAYLSKATWGEVNGFNGVAEFFFKQAEEERMHMIKLIKFVNGRGVPSMTPKVDVSKSEFTDLLELFTEFLASEQQVTAHVNEIVSQCLSEKDYITHNFMQWYVEEQAEEETLAQNILDKLNMIGNDKGGLYLFDRDLGSLDAQVK